jgi:hypothetical protein
MFNVQTSGVHILGCGLGVGPFTTLGSPQTKIVARLGNATDLIVVQSPMRATLASARLADFKLRDVFIDMGGSGRRAIYTTSCWDCEISYVEAINLNGDGGLYIEGGLVTDGGLDPGSYQYKLDHIYMQPLNNNTTTHPFFFDASNGEIAYITATFLRGDGPCCTGTFGGSDSYYVLTGSAAGDSFDQNNFNDMHGGNNATGAYGFKFVAQGNYNAGTGGRVYNIVLNNAQFERISLAASGTGIGCVDLTNTPNGTGCGAITAINLDTNNWTTDQDDSHLGAVFTCITCVPGLTMGNYAASGDYWANGSPSQIGVFNYHGTIHALTALQDMPILNSKPAVCDFASFNNSHCHSIFVDQTTTSLTNLGTGDFISGITVKPFSGTGAPANAYGIWITGNPAGATTNYGFRNDGTSYFASVFNDAPGFKHKRGIHGCTTAASAGSRCTTTVAWTTAFTDTGYTVTCSGNEVGKGVPLDGGTQNKSAASVEVITVNATGGAASFSDIECIAVHD